MNSNDLWPVLLNIPQDDWVNIKAGFNNLFTQVSKIGNNIQKNISSLNSYIEKNESKIQSFFKRIENFDSNAVINNFYQSYFSNIHKELIKHGFYVGLSNWSVAETSEISNLLIDNDHDKIVEYFLKHLHKDGNIDWFSKKWERNVFLDQELNLLKEG